LQIPDDDDMSDSDDPLLGRRVGSYEITDRLGSGGMGIVYRARHETLGREAALKALRLESTADPSRRERFIQEARSASALDHPGIVTIYDIVTEDDHDFLIMEYLEGRTLDRVIAAGGMDPAGAIDYAGQAADALAAAHERGIVHRDIKPSNMMVTTSGRVKLLDFGLAKLVQPEVGVDEAATRLTQAGSVMGTPDYMSPEQALGQEIDARTDVFSLGVVLYEMLCGQRPFRGDNWVEVVHAICSTEPEPASSVRADLPAGIDSMLTRALAKNRDQRFSSSAELAQALAEAAVDLPSFDRLSAESGAMTAAIPSGARSMSGGEAAVSGTAVGGGPGPATAEAAPTDTRRPIPKVTVALGLAAVALVVLLSLPVTRNAVLGEGGESGAVAEPAADLTPFELFERGSQFHESYYRAGSLDQAITSFGAALAQDADYAPAHAGLSLALLTQYQNENRDPLLLTRALESGRRAVALDQHLAVGRRALALALLERGDLEAAAAEIAEEERLDPGNPEGAFLRARMASAQGDEESAIRYLQEAIDTGPDSWRYHSELGTRYFSYARYDEAASEFRLVTEMSPDNAVGFQSLGAILHMLGEPTEAAGAFQRALLIQPDASTYSNLGTLHYFEARYTDAAAAFERAVEMEPNEYTFWVNLGDAYRWVPGRGASADEAFTRAIQLMRPAVGGGSLYLRTMLAESLAKRAGEGDVDEALAMLSALETDAGDDADNRFSMAKAYEIAGDREAALQSLEAALEGGYSTQEVANEPELTDLRADVRYHRMAVRFQ